MNPFQEIQFNRKYHTYSFRGKNLVSATTIVGKLEREVNWAEVAKKTAISRGVAVKTLQKEWSNKREKAALKGTQIHKYIERRLKHNTEKDTLYPEMIAFDNFWETAQQKMRLVESEMIVGDYELGIGGTVDTLFYSENTSKYHIFDWKSNEKFTHNNSWQTLLKPFEDLEDCHLTKYSLQLSIYKLILKRNTDLNLGKSYIIWLNNGHQKFECLDYADRLEKYLSKLCKIST